MLARCSWMYARRQNSKPCCMFTSWSQLVAFPLNSVRIFFQGDSDLRLDVGLQLFREFGPSPRTVLELVRDPSRISNHPAFVNLAARSVAETVSKTSLSLNHLNLYSDEVPSAIFKVTLDAKGDPLHRFASPSTMKAFTLALSDIMDAQQRIYFNLFRTHPSLGNSVGWFFEAYAHICISKPCLKDGRLNAYPSNSDNSSPKCIPAPDFIASTREDFRQRIDRCGAGAERLEQPRYL